MKPNCPSFILLCLTLGFSPWLEAAHGKPGAPAKPPAAKQSVRPPMPPPVKTGQSVPLLRLGYLRLERDSAALPYFDPPARDRGLQGARLGIEDDNTTGRFTRQKFELTGVFVARTEEVEAAFRLLLGRGHSHVLLDLPPEWILRLADLPEAANALLYDVASSDDALRGESCRANVLHLLPSRAMRADALAQYLVKKRWREWFLVVGPTEEDRLYAAAIARAAKRFGGKIVAEKTWQHEFTDRRTPESEVPVFTQGEEYDVLIVADEAGTFGDALSYRTWLPRPVTGTQGLVPTAWHKTLEAWGALQLQNRFRAMAKRWMGEVDYGAWLAVRAIGEAATRTKSLDFAAIRDFLRNDQLALAGFKGMPLSFRSWNGQLRQPVLLAADRSLIAVAPIEGFIHPKNELDTLGYDQSESTCRLSR